MTQKIIGERFKDPKISSKSSSHAHHWYVLPAHKLEFQRHILAGSKARINAAALLLAAVTLYSLASFLPSLPYYGPLSPLPIDTANILNSSSPFDWSSITPSTDLHYHPCYTHYQCARLELPMDYHATPSTSAATHTVAIALIRLPAKVPLTSPHHGGFILINPGGPGASGVDRVLTAGTQLQQIADAAAPPPPPTTKTKVSAASDKYFDIIGFDPRGVNHSTPRISCFPDAFSQQVWHLQREAEGLLGASSNMSLRLNWRRARALAWGCSMRLLEVVGGGRLAEHVNTTPVARDMLEIVEKVGSWREREVERLVSEGSGVVGGAEGDVEEVAALRERAKWKKGEEKLKYWGFSYGTVLGSTFAAMYPDRVERMVLDGVVDADDYYRGSWVNNLNDTDHILQSFFSTCYAAGPERCRLWREGGPEEVQTVYEKLLQDIWDDPLSVPGSIDRGPEIVTWSDLKLLVKDALYSPVTFFPILAELLEDVIHGNGSLFAEYKFSQRRTSSPCARSPGGGDPWSIPEFDTIDATPAILCTDAADDKLFTEDDFAQYWFTLRKQSKAMGDYWAGERLSCAGWQTRAKWRFDGPIAASQMNNPILWVGNTYDTVTPLGNARKMASRFGGSVVLQQNSIGHCSFTSPSLCTAKRVRHYFQTGRTPLDGEVCQPDVRPFEGVNVDARRSMSKPESDLIEAQEELLKTMQMPLF